MICRHPNGMIFLKDENRHRCLDCGAAFAEAPQPSLAPDGGPDEEDGPWAKGWAERSVSAPPVVDGRTTKPMTEDEVEALARVAAGIAYGHGHWGTLASTLQETYRGLARGTVLPAWLLSGDDTDFVRRLTEEVKNDTYLPELDDVRALLGLLRSVPILRERLNRQQAEIDFQRNRAESWERTCKLIAETPGKMPAVTEAAVDEMAEALAHRGASNPMPPLRVTLFHGLQRALAVLFPHADAMKAVRATLAPAQGPKA